MADLQDIVFTREGTASTLPAGQLGHVATCVLCQGLQWSEAYPAVMKWARAHKCPKPRGK